MAGSSTAGSATTGTAGTPAVPTTDSSEDIYTEYEASSASSAGMPGNPTVGSGAGSAYTPGAGSSSGDGAPSSTPSGMAESGTAPDDVFQSEYEALLDENAWPITTLDEMTTLVGPSMYVMSGDVISTKMSIKYPGCLAMMEMIQEDPWVPNTGWNAVISDNLSEHSWYPGYAARTTASIGIWRTPTQCTYTDPDQGVVQQYWANIFGHAAAGDMADPIIKDTLYRNTGPMGGVTEFGNQILIDPLQYNWREVVSLNEKFGFTEVGGGDPVAECVYRLNRSLDDILDNLEAGFVPRTDVVKIVPRIKIENRAFERITEKEGKEETAIGQTVGNTNMVPNVVSITSRIAITTSRQVQIMLAIPGTESPAVSYLAPAGEAGALTAPTPGSAMPGADAGAVLGSSTGGSSSPGPALTMGGFVGGTTFPGPMGGPSMGGY